jgi:biotin carboxyl carrier protein
MKLSAELADEKHEIEIKREDGRVRASIDGRHYDLEVSEPEPNVYLIKHEGRIFAVSVGPAQSGDGSTDVRVGTNEYSVRISDPKRLRSTAGADGHIDGTAEIKTAMPGKVVRLLVELGAEVEKGDGIVVVEAMKMQNELKSPKAGIIKAIRVAEGSTVSAGETLVTVE